MLAHAMKVMMFSGPDSRQRHEHCKRYIHMLQHAGCNVTFIEYRGVKLPDVPNVTYRRYPRRFRQFEKMLGTRTTYFLRNQSMRLLWRLVRPDICHKHWVDDNLWHIARAGLRPLVVTAWGADLNLPAKLSADDPERKKIAATLRLIDHLIVDSDDMAVTAKQLAGRNLSTTLLPIGIDTEQFRPRLYQQRKEWRQRLRIDPDATVVLSARQLGANNRANYRQAEIIRAFAALNDTHRRHTYLIIRTLGFESGVLLTELHSLADRLNVSDQIRWVEEVESSELPGIYAASDLAVNFPIMDGFPVTLLECFACGIPVVSNRLTAYDSNGASSYLLFVRDDSVGGLKTAIKAAIERLDQLQTLTAEAREHVVRNYDARVTARILRQTYEAVLGRIGTDARRMGSVVH